jgi:ubiquinol-cytochrome c reductase iron-sulfur subunit
MSNQPVDQSRRTWVTMACAAGGVGGVATAIPFVSTFQPSERAKAAGAAVESVRTWVARLREVRNGPPALIA